MGKRWCSFDEQAALLAERGLRIRDPEAAKRLLKQVGYYRLSEYLRYWQRDPERGDKTFVDGASFETVRGVYAGETMLADVAIAALRRLSWFSAPSSRTPSGRSSAPAAFSRPTTPSPRPRRRRPVRARRRPCSGT